MTQGHTYNAMPNLLNSAVLYNNHDFGGHFLIPSQMADRNLEKKCIISDKKKTYFISGLTT